MVTFVDLLRNARRLKKLGWSYIARRAYLMGMIRASQIIEEKVQP